MKKLQIFLTLALLLGFSVGASAQEIPRHQPSLHFSKGKLDPRSDSIDILQYNIELDIRDFVGKRIAGNCLIAFKNKLGNVHTLNLDLLQMQVDSVKIDDVNIPFVYDNAQIQISIPASYPIGQIHQARVYYQGIPKMDPSGWGGFYFNGNYAYNLGVGFESDPHVFGRVWFPCFDNFTERSKFSFSITTDGGKLAYCNGQLQSDTTISGLRTRVWYLEEEVPSYLVSVAVGPYVDLYSSHPGLTKNIPILVASAATDTPAVKTGFQNLKAALQSYENRFGPYEWSRVGYALVPFQNGAMEHATNIAYPRSFATSGSTYETIMAHELSHHWFGNLITCSSQEDMWINEGWASFCESIFLEEVYGKSAYKNNIRNTHAALLLSLIYEEGLQSLDSIPWQYTYGNYVYKKGAMVAHALRGYLGDSLFFSSLQSFLSKNKYKSISSEEFLQGLSAEAGKDLQYFLADWVAQPGWADFEVNNYQFSGVDGNYIITLNIEQKNYSTRHAYQQVPLKITVMSDAMERYDRQVFVNGGNNQLIFTSPVAPDEIYLDYDEQLSLANITQSQMIKQAGNFNYPLARMNVTVSSVQDSVLMHIGHHFVAPDEAKRAGFDYRSSPTRYWTVQQLGNQSLKANAKVFYDGRAATVQLDYQLNISHEDSLTLLYRQNGSADWSVFPHYTKFPGTNSINQYGYVMIDSLWEGQYCFAMGAPVNVGMQNKKENPFHLKIFPNPAHDFLQIEFEDHLADEIIDAKIVSMNGSLVRTLEIGELGEGKNISLAALPAGMYLLQVESTSGISTQKFTIKK